MTSELVQQDEKGRFLPGNTGFGGRPKGARNKLGEAFIKALEADFAEHGVAAIETVRSEKPDVYVKVIASLLPSEHNVNINNDELSDDELIERIRSLAAVAQPFLGGAGIDLSAVGVEQPAEPQGRARQPRQVH